MALTQNDISIYDFIRLTNAGVDIASFVQIRDAITNRYKEVYGQDIDVSTATADGVFINDISLIINNILQSIKTMYSNLDVNSASGVYLENLCRLSNISRRPATQSIASITLKNTGSTLISIIPSYKTNGSIFIDKAGNEWLYDGTQLMLQPYNVSNNELNIRVKSKEYGQVVAEAGWISSMLGNIYVEVTQSENAIVGELEESDSELRARRVQSIGAAGTTVLESLVGALLSLSGIEDVKIYNNNQDIYSENGQSATKDGCNISPHSVYIILRRAEGIIFDNNDEYGGGSSTIGNLIFQKLTPGIGTQDASSSGSGVGKKYAVQPTVEGLSNVSSLIRTVYWKEASPIAPDIDITIVALPYFDTSYFEQIISTLVEYLNQTRLSTDIDYNDFLVEVIYADPQFKAAATYTVSNIVGFTDGKIVNPDTYFKYSVSASSYTPLADTSSGLRQYKIQLRGEEINA